MKTDETDNRERQAGPEGPAGRTLPTASGSISVIIPAFNEERRLPPTLIECATFLAATGRPHEILVVDDGSTDGTLAKVEEIAQRWSSVRGVRVPVNQGKGNAVRTGMRAAQSELILFMDADGSTPMSELEKLEREVAAGADVAIGSRALPSDSTTVSTSIHRKLLGRAFNTFANVLVIPDIKDTQCGFKLFRRRAAKFLASQQRIKRFGFDIELLFIARRSGLRIAEIPVNWTNVIGSRVNLVIDAADMFFDLFRILWWHRGVTPESYESFVEE